MPVYNFGCAKECGWGKEAYLPLRESENPACESCGAPSERIWSLGVTHRAASTFPYITTHITADGSPVEVKSAMHLEQLCKENGVTHRPDKAWETQEYQGVDFRTGKQRYKEGNGVGMPGCWV